MASLHLRVLSFYHLLFSHLLAVYILHNSIRIKSILSRIKMVLKFLRGLFAVGMTLIVLSLILVVVFAVVYVSIKTPKTTSYSSAITGGDLQSHYTWECNYIEINSFTPDIRIVAYLQKSDLASRRETNSTQRILESHSLQVGHDSSQLTYYGVPVFAGDKVNLFIRTSMISPLVQSVNVSVYDTEGFGQLIYNTSTNANSLYNYTLGMNCLQSMSGCNITSVVISNGWLYFVFMTTPTRSTLVVTIEATVHKYDTPQSKVTDMCTLYGISSKCSLQVPTWVVEQNGNSRVIYYPFIITYKAYSLNISNVTPSSQSLNTSVDLSTTCIHQDNRGIYIIFLCMAVVCCVVNCMPVSIIGYCVCINDCKRYKHHSEKNRYRSDLQFETGTETDFDCECCPDLDCESCPDLSCDD